MLHKDPDVDIQEVELDSNVVDFHSYTWHLIEEAFRQLNERASRLISR